MKKPVVEWDGNPVPMEQWGKDHWSTLAYAETRAMDHDGYLGAVHMRMDKNYPTYGKSFNIRGHTDLDCLKDAEAEGLLTVGRASRKLGSRIELTHRVEFTPVGLRVAAKLRAHKIEGGTFSSFVPYVAGEDCHTSLV